MRAQIIREYGGPEAFESVEMPDPSAGPGEVLVQVAVASVNPLDWKVRSGALRAMLPTVFPAVLGNEIAGVVLAVGAGVTGFAVGDRVAGFTTSGAYRELVATSADRLALIPDTLSFEQAATVPTAAETAQRALSLIDVQAGETVLVNAAAGSVGSAVVQLLVAAGAIVFGTASVQNHPYVRSLGATPVRYGEQLLADLSAAAPQGVDAAFDGGGRGFVDQALAFVPADRIVTIVDFAAGAKGVRVAGGDPFALTAATIAPVLALAAEGRFATEAAVVLPLDQVAEAHRLSEAGHLRGKILLRVSPRGLWEPVRIGDMQLPHRLALAPMTRSRALADGTPGPLAAEYYAQRAGLGLLITEGTQPSDDGQGYLMTPGIYRPEHVAGWRRIADAVHAQGGHLVIQLMHVGRMSHPDNTPHHRQPIGPSAIAAGVDMFTANGTQPIPQPRAMTTDDIAQTIADFRHAARSAVEAGADAVELHAANGYLLHQFLSPNANQRDDRYGGSVGARSQFVVEVATAVADEIGAERVGIRVSPGLAIGGIDEGEGENVREQYAHLVRSLAPLRLAYLHAFQLFDEELLADLRAAWPGALLVLRAGRTRETLDQDVAAGLADAVPVGRWALANPDIVERLRIGAPLGEADPATFYGGGAQGYTDYPRVTA